MRQRVRAYLRYKILVRESGLEMDNNFLLNYSHSEKLPSWSAPLDLANSEVLSFACKNNRNCLAEVVAFKRNINTGDISSLFGWPILENELLHDLNLPERTGRVFSHAPRASLHLLR